MSAAAVRHALRTVISGHGFSEEASEDVASVLATIEDSFFDLAFDLAAWRRSEIGSAILRAAAVGAYYASVQLADDLADGDVPMDDRSARRAPGTQALLQTLAFVTALEAGAGRTCLQRALRLLLRTGSIHQWEIRRSRWDVDAFRRAAEGLNGAQYAAYFVLLLEGSPFAPRAEEIGTRFGHVLHVVGDIHTDDRRWSALDEEGRREVRAWARRELDDLFREELPPIRRHLGLFRAALGN